MAHSHPVLLTATRSASGEDPLQLEPARADLVVVDVGKVAEVRAASPVQEVANLEERPGGDPEEPYLVADVDEPTTPFEGPFAAWTTALEQRIRQRPEGVERRMSLPDHNVLELVRTARHPARAGNVDEEGRGWPGLYHLSMI
jgi:hypothetical protein